MSKKAMKLALEAAYLAGFNASGEGYNGEYPFRDHARNPEEDAAWIKDRDNALREALAEQPAPVQGWKLVPVEPTPEQIKEGNKVTWPLPCAQVYSAMLAAAPQPAPPPQRKPLTDEQIDRALDAAKVPELPGQFFDTHSRTPQQKLVPYEPSIDMQEQGSIASGYDLSQARAKKVYQAMIDMHDVMMEREPTDEWFRLQAGYPEQPAQPAQRKPWVGLTDDEILYCVELENPKAIAEEVEAKLKEKNT